MVKKFKKKVNLYVKYLEYKVIGNIFNFKKKTFFKFFFGLVTLEISNNCSNKLKL